jgi:hypothetical protein
VKRGLEALLFFWPNFSHVDPLAGSALGVVFPEIWPKKSQGWREGNVLWLWCCNLQAPGWTRISARDHGGSVGISDVTAQAHQRGPTGQSEGG